MRIIKIVLLSLLFCGAGIKVHAQAAELEQLALDYEKLAQLKKILQNMYKGYEIVSQGYTTVKDITKGNFNLHKDFLDALLAVSPAVRNYQRLAEIISNQSLILSEYKAAYKKFSANPSFSASELSYMTSVYSNLVKECTQDLSELTNVITGGTLRMSDDERLKEIDHIADKTEEKLSFLRQFNNKAQILAVQRAKEQNDASTVQQLYGIKN